MRDFGGDAFGGERAGQRCGEVVEQGTGLGKVVEEERGFGLQRGLDLGMGEPDEVIEANVDQLGAVDGLNVEEDGGGVDAAGEGGADVGENPVSTRRWAAAPRPSEVKDVPWWIPAAASSWSWE